MFINNNNNLNKNYSGIKKKHVSHNQNDIFRYKVTNGSNSFVLTNEKSNIWLSRRKLLNNSFCIFCNSGHSIYICIPTLGYYIPI